MATSRTREATAYYEAGHFVMAYFLRLSGCGLPQVRRVTILPGVEWAGLDRWYRPPALRPEGGGGASPRTQLRIHAEIMAFLAGTVAESRYRGRPATGARRDVTQIAKLVAVVAPRPEDKRAVLRWLSLLAERLVAAVWPTIDVVAQALLANGMLTGVQLRDILREADNVAPAARRGLSRVVDERAHDYRARRRR